MATPTTVTPPTIHLTANAVNKIHKLIEEKGNLELMLRIFIKGGGCSGFEYGFAFEGVINPDDTVITETVSPEDDEDGEGGTGRALLPEVKLVVNAASYPYLVGATIDYKVDVQGEQFVIDNPNAATTCGCGSSFSI